VKLAGLARNRRRKENNVRESAEIFHKGVCARWLEMLGHLHADREVKATVQLQRGLEVVLDEAPGRNDECISGHPGTVHAEYVFRAKPRCHAEPGAGSTPNVDDTRRRYEVENQGENRIRGAC
jgi:hypothetical protein